MFPIPREVDLVVAEAGIGGQGDATAALGPCLGVLTSVGLDHQQVLGSSLQEIAAQKVGAWRAGSRAVLGTTQPALRRPLRRMLEARGVRVLALDEDLRTSHSKGLLRLEGPLGGLRDIPVPLAGSHQLRNAALASAAALWLGRMGLGIKLHHVGRGLQAVRWPGRLEQRSHQGASILLDAAHNPAAARSLAQALPPGPIHLLAGLSEPHDPRPFLIELLPHVSSVTLTQAAHRGLPVEALARACRGTCLPDSLLKEPRVSSALEVAARRAREAGATLVITGSIFLLDEALQAME